MPDNSDCIDFPDGMCAPSGFFCPDASDEGSVNLYMVRINAQVSLMQKEAH